jgi:hypothetical protein
MPEVSQRTLGKVIVALTDLYSEQQRDSPFFARDFWRTKLFERGFPNWLNEFVLEERHNWSSIVPWLFSGEARDRLHAELGRAERHSMLVKLTALAYEETTNRTTKEAIRLSLQLDGFEVSDGGLRPIDGPVSVDGEKSRLLSYLSGSSLGRKDVISKHIEDAQGLFSHGHRNTAVRTTIRDHTSLAACPFEPEWVGGVANGHSEKEVHHAYVDWYSRNQRLFRAPSGEAVHQGSLQESEGAF